MITRVSTGGPAQIVTERDGIQVRQRSAAVLDGDRVPDLDVTAGPERDDLAASFAALRVAHWSEETSDELLGSIGS